MHDELFKQAQAPSGDEVRLTEIQAVAAAAFAHAEAGEATAMVADLDALLGLGASEEAAALLGFLSETVVGQPPIIEAVAASLYLHGQTALGGAWPAVARHIDTVLAPSVKSVAKTSSLWINLTSRCNLRCVYCTVGKPGHIDRDISDVSLEKILAFIREVRPTRVMVGCYTETTSYDGWVEVVRAITDQGLSVNVISNLARLLDAEEIDTLARCATLQTSIDTIDRDRLKEVRKGADIRTILYNVVRIRGRALELGITPPRMEWICVPTRENFSGLMEYVGCAIACGVSSISINPVLQFQDAKQKLPDLLDFPDAELREVFAKFEAAAAFAFTHGVAFALGNRDLIEERLRNSETTAKPESAVRGELVAALGRVSFYARQLHTGMTRLCSQPWDNVVLSDKGELYPCTICGTPLANLDDYERLDDALSSPALVKWKQNLLDGTPGQACVNCLRAPEGSIKDLRALVRNLAR